VRVRCVCVWKHTEEEDGWLYGCMPVAAEAELQRYSVSLASFSRSGLFIEANPVNQRPSRSRDRDGEGVQGRRNAEKGRCVCVCERERERAEFICACIMCGLLAEKRERETVCGGVGGERG